MYDVKAVVLAAGEGKRLRPITYGIPKPLLPVGGRPVIDYVMDNLMKCREIDTVYVAVSHMRVALESYLSNVKYDGIEVEPVTTLGWETGGDLKTVLLQKGIREEPILVCYGDNVTSIDAGALVSAHERNADSYATVSLFSVPQKDVPRFGIAELSSNRITRFLEKPPLGATESRAANAGYFVLESSALAGIPMRRFKIESEYFPSWAQAGKLYGHMQDLHFWMDVGTIEAYREANKLVEEILPPPEEGEK